MDRISLKASNAISSGTAPAQGCPATGDSSSRAAERFRLTGPTRPVDPRLDAWRKDLADIGLAGRIFAPHYARPLVRGCGSRAALVQPAPAAEGDAVSQLLPGETFAVLEYAGGWAWGYAQADHIVGYVEAIALTEPVEPTHIVCEKSAPVAPDRRITSSILATLPMGSRLHGHETGACLATEYGSVALSHLRPIADHEPDPVAVAERLMGAPYFVGGRTMNGIDAAGLVQLALGLCGLSAPRLRDQLRELGEAVAKGPARRGDLILFEGGAGLMVDDLLMIHASRAAGKVSVEPVAAVAMPVTARRRLPL